MVTYAVIHLELEDGEDLLKLTLMIGNALSTPPFNLAVLVGSEFRSARAAITANA